MATHQIAADEHGAHAVTLTAGTVEYFKFADDASAIEITSHDGAAAIYYTLDGSDPTVAGTKTKLIPAAITTVEDTPLGSGPTEVKLISSGTPTVSITRA